MHGLVSYLTGLISSVGSLAYLIIGAVSTAESVAFVGLLIPSTAVLGFAGFLAAQGALNPWLLLIVATIGSIMGDCFSFYIGRRGGLLFRPENKLFKLRYLEKGEAFFKKYGDKSVFLAHFISPLRPTIPFVAGLLRMRVRTFFAYDIASALLGCAFYIGLGYFFGHAANEAERTFGKTEWILIGAAIILLAGYFFKRHLVRYGREIISGIRLLFGPLVRVFLAHHVRLQKFVESRKRSLFSLTFGFCFSIVILLSITILTKKITIIFDPGLLGDYDLKIAQWFYRHRSRGLAQVLFVITFLGSTKAVAVITAIISGLLIKYRKHVHIISLWVAMIGAAGMVWFTKHWILRSRPETAFYAETGFSFPSGHAMGAEVLYGWIIFYTFVGSNSWSRKMNVLFACSMMMLLMSFTRLYLGVHYLSDVITGFIVGLLWLGVGIGVEKMWVRRKALKKEVN